MISPVSDRLAVLPQYLLPKQALTILAGKLASAQAGSLTTGVIRWFVGRYGVNMAEAANPDIASYQSFNEFFTRPLQAGARPLAEADFLSPVDGAISQFGAIERDQIFQAKGHSYSTDRAGRRRPRSWPRNSPNGELRHASTSARATTTASTCPAPAA